MCAFSERYESITPGAADSRTVRALRLLLTEVVRGGTSGPSAKGYVDSLKGAQAGLVRVNCVC